MTLLKPLNTVWSNTVKCVILNNQKIINTADADELLNWV